MFALTASGCSEQETTSPAGPAVDRPESGTTGITAAEKATLYPVIAELASGTSKVTFYDAGEGNVYMTQLMDAGRDPLVEKSMDGLTYAEFHARLAPGMPVPVLLAAARDTFRIALPEDLESGESASLPGTSGTLAKRAGQWDLWFQQNYCVSVNQCLLNRTGAATDWVQSTYRKYSFFNVLVYQGYQITTMVKIAGNTGVTGTVLYGQVWYGSGRSGTDFWGYREKKTHRLDISDGSGDGWHIAASYI